MWKTANWSSNSLSCSKSVPALTNWLILWLRSLSTPHYYFLRPVPIFPSYTETLCNFFAPAFHPPQLGPDPNLCFNMLVLAWTINTNEVSLVLSTFTSVVINEQIAMSTNTLLWSISFYTKWTVLIVQMAALVFIKIISENFQRILKLLNIQSEKHQLNSNQQ